MDHSWQLKLFVSSPDISTSKEPKADTTQALSTLMLLAQGLFLFVTSFYKKTFSTKFFGCTTLCLLGGKGFYCCYDEVTNPVFISNRNTKTELISTFVSCTANIGTMPAFIEAQQCFDSHPVQNVIVPSLLQHSKI